MNWNQLYNREIIKENPVLGINTVELLEKNSTYLNNKENYFNRIKKSLEYIPNEFQDAALAIFSNVIYVPNDFMKATHHFFGKNFKEKYNLHTSEQIGESSHIFEVDPSGLKNSFFQINGIYQRLHPDYYARIDDIADVSKTLLGLFHTDKDIINSAYNEVVKLGRKAHWIILTDKVMSGQSLSKDIERYILFRDIASQVTNNLPLIDIKAQIITEDAINTFYNQHIDFTEMDLDYAILFNEEMKINSDTCRLFNSSKIHSNAIKLCSWLAEQVIQPDERFNTMREKSGDNLQFGYKQCGLTLVDSSNCPTNSIPLLWYNNTDTKLSQKYKGPFPRVQSRLGIQLEQPMGNSWDKIAARKTGIIQILKGLNHASES